MRLTCKELVLLAEEAGYEVRSYSGRAMYERKCPGIVSSVSGVALGASLVLAAVHLSPDGAEFDSGAVAGAMSEVREDSMGRETVFYWPNIEWVSEEEESEEEEDEDGD